MPIVSMPDGTRVRFPDDMPREQIKGLIAQKFPDVSPADVPPQPAGPEKRMTVEEGLEDVGRSAASGLGRGLPHLIDLAGAGIGYGAAKLAGQPVTFQQALEVSPVNKFVSKYLGEEYQPQTYVGEMAKMGGEAIGTLPLGGTGALTRPLAMRAGVGGAASVPGADVGGEVAAQEFGEDARVYGQIGGGLVAGGAGAAYPELRKGATRYFRKGAIQGTPNVLSDVGQDVAVGGIGDKVRELAKQRKQQVDELYGVAEELGKSSYITAQPAWELMNRLRFEASNVADDTAKKTLLNAAGNVRDRVKDGMIKINDLAAMRKGLQGGTFGEGKAKSIIDEVIEKAIDNGKVAGPPEAGKAWKAATVRAREYYRTFDNPEVNPIVKKIINTTDMTDEDLAASLFGAGSITTGRKAAQRYDEVVRVLGREVEPDLKRAVVSKIFQFSMEPTGDAAKDMAWLQRISREVNGMRTRNKSLWNKFSADEQATLNQMAEAAQKVSQGGLVQKIGEKVVGLGNRLMKTDIRLPSTLQPKQIAPVEDIIKLGSTRAPAGWELLKQDVKKLRGGK